MARMEIDSSSGRDALLSPRDSILQRLSRMGIPTNYLDVRQPGLVAFVLENPTRLSEVILTILPTDAYVFQAEKVSSSGTGKESKSVSTDIFVECLLWLQWLMFRDEPQVALKKLAEKEIDQRAVCGAVWGRKDLAYRCRTCEHDPTCAICVPCFQNGNHKDHDYSIIYTGGGCCDCGDITAWKSEGFCSKHVGTEQIQPFPQEDADSLGPVLDALFLYWKDKLLAIEGNAEKHPTEDGHTDLQWQVFNVLSFVVVEMLLDFCRCSESLLCFVSRRISQSAGLLDLLVKGEKFLNNRVVKKLHELLLKSLGEPIFKYEFAKIFIQYYPHAIQEAVEKPNDSVNELHLLLSTFSVQIFTVPTLTLRLVREENLLGVLLECLGELFYSCVGEDGHLKADKWYKLHVTSVRLVEDIRFSLSHAEVPRYIANERPDVFRTWLRLIGLVQGMDPQRRVTGLHTEEEYKSLYAPFVLGCYLGKVHNLLVEGAFSASEFNRVNSPPPGDPGMGSSDHGDQQRHAKVGRLSQESSVCCLSDRENAMGFFSQSTDAKLSVGYHIIPSTVTWLLSECLQVIENCLEPENRQEIVASLDCNSSMGNNLLNFRKKLFQSRSSKNRTTVYRRSMPSSSCAPDECHMDADLESIGVLSLASWPEILYDVSSQEISFHIPLHRFLSLLLHRSMKTCYNETGASASSGGIASFPFSGHDFFSQALGKYHPYGFSAFVMESPLRLRVVCAQVHAGMWRRNGDAGTFMTEWYHAVRWFETLVEVDLFLLQCCAALAPPESFVTRIQERFGLLNYLSLNLAQSNEYEPVLMQEMLTLIIQIVKERRFCGMSLTGNLQRELVHKLAVGDATHSQLIKALPRDLAESKQLQEVVDTVAVYRKPSSMKQGKYSLRSSYWKELDIYHPRWNRRDLQVAEERYLQICKVSPLDVQLPRWTKIFSPLSTISRIATSKSVLQIVRAVLFYAVSAKTPSASRAPEGVLVTALHLLALALDTCEKHKDVHAKYMANASEESCSGVSLPAESKIPVLEFATEPICTGLCKDSGIGKCESLISLLVLLMRKHKKENGYSDSRLNNIPSLIESILKKFSQLNGDCMNELKTLAPDVVFQMPEYSSNSSMLNIKSPSDSDESRKLKSRERQAAILEKMRAEQSKFAASFKSMEKDDLDMYEDLAPVCSLCHDTNSKSPLSFLVLLQKSRLSSFVSRGPPTWEEIDNSADHPSVIREGPIDMAIDAPSSSELGSLQSGFHDLHQTEFDTVLDLTISRIPHVRHIQSPYLSNTETNSLPSIETMEKNIYLLVVEFITHHKLQSDILTSDQLPMLSVATKGLKNHKNTESCDAGDRVSQLYREVSKNHTSSGSPRHFEDASPISTIPSLMDCDGIHISSCGHAVHQECHNRYLSSLKQRYLRRLGFEGGHIVDPDMGELLCPVCRRFANSVLPVSSACSGSSDMWKQKILPDGSSASSAGSTPLLNSDNNSPHLPHALSLLQGMGKLMKQGKYSLHNCLKMFPVKGTEAMESALRPILRKLSEMYFPHENSMSGPSKLSQSLMLWDTLRYSLISTEIAARGSDITGSEVSNSCVQGLYKELHSSNGLILAELLQVAHATRYLSRSHLLLRFGGVQPFVNSVCAGVIGESNMSNCDWKQDALLSILERVEKGEGFPGIQFWKFAADPVLAHDPFTSLMWILFSLPLPFMMSTESFLPLVHLFYVVCVVQALITCQREHHFDKASVGDSVVYDICKTLGESSFAGQYFASNHFDDSCTLNNMIRKFTFPYLRRCALLWILLKSSSSAPFCDTLDGLTLGMENIASCSTDSLQADISGVIEFENIFQICSLDTFFNDKLVQSLALKWCEHFLQAYKAYTPGNVLYSTTAVSFRLMQLPLLYQNLLERYIKRKCPNCGNVPEEPALCLLCGSLCSPSWEPCCRTSGCKIHSTICGAGIGIFLLVKRTTILLQRSARQSLWPSLYLDAFGEEDHDMDRGKPLYLSNERYLDLANLVASHGLDHSSEVLQRTGISLYTFE